MSKKKRKHGMSWEDILKYDDLICAIAIKYSGDRILAEDVAQEVRLRLHTDTRLDISKFDPNKLMSAIGNTIRNKTIKVLKSKALGRLKYDSFDHLISSGFQISSHGDVLYPHTLPATKYPIKLNPPEEEEG
jgi:hypothetical protein